MTETSANPKGPKSVVSLAARLLVLPVCLSATAAAPQQPSRQDLGDRLKGAVMELTPFINDPAPYRLQVAVALPTAQPDGSIALERQTLGDLEQYFYPASSIKICAPLAVLQFINEHNRTAKTPLTLDTPFAVEPRFAGDARRGPQGLSLRRSIRALFVVSDNQAFNDLYELVGHRRLNEAMHSAGFPSLRLFHRLSEFRSPQEQRQTRGVAFAAGTDEAIVFPQRDSDLVQVTSFRQGLDIGRGFMRSGALVEGAMDFRQKNAIHLLELQDLLVAVLRPEIRTGRAGFPELSLPQRQFVVDSLGLLPRDCEGPRYDPADYPDHYTKLLLPGVRRVIPREHLRIYTKIGRAYGFSVSNAYVEDLRTGRGVFVAAVLYTNADSILNDDRYGYEDVADPFLANLGEAVARLYLQ